MPRTLRSTTSVKNSLSLFVLGVLALIIVVGAFALQQSNGFSLLPRASTLSSGSTSTTSPYMCQVECATDIQCGKNQICATKPGSISKQKFCYNPSCPDNKQCGGEGCGECKELSKEGYLIKSQEQCLADCKSPNICKRTHSGSYVCVEPTACSIDQIGIGYQTTQTSLTQDTYLRVRKDNFCPISDYGQCPAGLRCDEIRDMNKKLQGIKFTRISEGFVQEIFMGLDCPCAIGICGEGDNYSANRLEVGQYYLCTFESKTCAGPLGP